MKANKVYLSISYRDPITNLFFSYATITENNKVFIVKIGAKRKYFKYLGSAMQYVDDLKIM